MLSTSILQSMLFLIAAIADCKNASEKVSVHENKKEEYLTETIFKVFSHDFEAGPLIGQKEVKTLDFYS